MRRPSSSGGSREIDMPSGRTLRLRLSPNVVGFTLVELLVVIAIIGILVALVATGRAVGTRVGSSHDLHQPHAASGAAPS